MELQWAVKDKYGEYRTGPISESEARKVLARTKGGELVRVPAVVDALPPSKLPL